MSNLEEALYQGQGVGSPTASQVLTEAFNLPRSALENPPPTSGNKRRLSSSSPESVRKRQSLIPEPAPTPEPLKPLLAESNWHCSNCGTPCWGCFSRPEVPPDLASLNEEEDIDRLRIASAPPTQGAVSTQSGTTENTTSTTSRKKRKQCQDAGMEYVGPKDENFQIHILSPLRVRLPSSRSAGTTPQDIFGEPKSTPESRVILSKEDDELTEITLDFEEYKRRNYDEHTLFTLCSDSIVPRDRFIDAPFDEDQNIRKAVRRDKWKPKKEGPSIPPGPYTYDWDIEPDTTYGVSIRIFDAKQRWELGCEECLPWLAESDMVCPYLTVEYKCTEKIGKTSHAMNQNTAASILWLYQRKQIRQALNLTLDGLKHFSVTFVDSNFAIWEASFQNDFYCLRKIAHGDATILDGIRLYIRWSNAIHSWGLGPNADSFKKDIEALLERRRGGGSLLTPPSTRSPKNALQQSRAV